jgi:hypothetical protein
MMTFLSISLFIIASHYTGQTICWINDDKRLPLFVGALFFIKIALALTVILTLGYLGAELIK